MKIIGLASYKGCVGTSLSALCISQRLQATGKRVCLVDCKYSGTLDISCGVCDDVLFGLSDIADGRAPCDCIVPCGNISFISAPLSKGCIGAYKVLAALDSFDFMILDSPEDCSICDTVLIVTSLTEQSVRAAEQLCTDIECEKQLLITRFAEFKNQILPYEIRRRTKTEIAGIIPFVPYLKDGEAPFEIKNAYSNTARRLTGQAVPFFEGSAHKRTFGKMAAERDR